MANKAIETSKMGLDSMNIHVIAVTLVALVRTLSFEILPFPGVQTDVICVSLYSI